MADWLKQATPLDDAPAPTDTSWLSKATPLDASPRDVADSGPAAVGHGIINGVPIIGPYLTGGLNNVAASIRAAKEGTTFAAAKAKVEGFNRDIEEAHPIAYGAGELAGGVIGTAPLIAAAPAAFGASAGPIGGRIAASLGSGAVLNGADTAVRSGGDWQSTAYGAGIGAGLGAVSPVAGQLAGRAVTAAGEAFAARGIRVPGVGNEAAGKLATDLTNSGGVAPVKARLGELGPDAMLLDASPSFEGRAQGLAVLPDTRETVTRPLVERARGANDRLAGDVERSIGPATEPATYTTRWQADYDRAVPPLYQRALAEPIEVDTSRTLATIDALRQREKGGASSALDRAWGYLHTEGEVPGVGRASIPDRHPEALHNAKEALDADIARVRDQTGSSARSELRALTAVRNSLNAALEGDVPGYGYANRTAEAMFKRREAFGQGQTLLNGGRDAVRPAQLAQERAAMAPEVRDDQRLGLRAEVDRLVGTKVNDRVALADALKGEGDWNRARMGEVFGDKPTADLVGAVERERAFDGSHQRIVNNSMTELRKRAADDVAVREVKPSAGDTSIALAGALGGHAGVAGAAGLKAGRMGLNAIGREADIARNRELADAVTRMSGPELDALLDALQSRASGSRLASTLGDLAGTGVQATIHSQGDRSRRYLPLGSRGQRP